MTADFSGHHDHDHGRIHRRFRYGPWRGGPDPLAPPYDVREAIDQIGADVMSAGNLRDSLRDLKHVVTVPADTAARARRAIDRMLAIG